MSDAWEEIQAIKSKRNSLRERLEKRKKERQDILGSNLGSTSPSTEIHTNVASASAKDELKVDQSASDDLLRIDPEQENELLKMLSEISVQLPIVSLELVASLKLTHKNVCNLLEKFATQKLIVVKETMKDGGRALEVTLVEVSKVNAMILDASKADIPVDSAELDLTKRKRNVDDAENEEERRKKERKEPKADILSLLAMPSTKEKESKKLGEEILDLLSKPTAKERSLAERFRSQGGKQLMEFCPHGTRADCERNGISDCKKLHFKKIIQKHTDESLGDCSFLNTCFHMDTCKYVHYEVDRSGQPEELGPATPNAPVARVESTTLYPPQWVQCDLRYLDMTALGKILKIVIC